ncbi:protein N-lysine methyltransferase METTL21A [Hordeum vulgare]|nr:protein N-lysine methyltransferase METTL21A [Hordeum vulgare]
MAAASSSAALQAPVSLNDKAAAMGSSVDGDRAAGDCGLAAPRLYDLVVAIDVVYVQEPVPHLIAAMDALADVERGVMLLGYQIRSPEAHQAFWDAVPAAFPVIEKEKPPATTSGTTAPVYPEWPGFQGNPAMPPHGFFPPAVAAGQAHPYMWGAQFGDVMLKCTFCILYTVVAFPLAYLLVMIDLHE